MPCSRRSTLRAPDTTGLLRIPILIGVGLAAAGCTLTFAPSEGPTLQPGLYVLDQLGEQPAPFHFDRVDFGDTLSVVAAFAFDSIRIVNDSDFSRHFRRELTELRPGKPTVLVDFEEFNYSGIILHRGEEVKLTARTGPQPGGTPLAYFALKHGALARHTEIFRTTCAENRCNLRFDHRVDAWYARRP